MTIPKSLIGVLVLAAAGSPAGAQVPVAPSVSASQEADVDQPPLQQAEEAGAFLPFSQTASGEGRRSLAVGLAGYDSAAQRGTFEARAEVRAWGPITVGGGAVYTQATDTLRPSFGARVQLLRRARHGVDGSVGVFYRPEGLTEPEGEIEGVASVGLRVAGTYLLGNLLYGQDPEASERDAELRLAALTPIGARFLAGFDSRLRVDLGSSPAKLVTHQEPTADALVGPCGTAVLGPFALTLSTGASALRRQGQTRYGAFGIMAVGTTF
jgi:hypothetical protein